MEIDRKVKKGKLQKNRITKPKRRKRGARETTKGKGKKKST